MLSSLLTAMCLDTINSTTKFSPAISRWSFAGLSGLSVHLQTEKLKRITPQEEVPSHTPDRGGRPRTVRLRATAPPRFPQPLLAEPDDGGTPQPRSLPAGPSPRTPSPDCGGGLLLTWGWRNSNRWGLKRWTWPAQFSIKP